MFRQTRQQATPIPCWPSRHLLRASTGSIGEPKDLHTDMLFIPRHGNPLTATSQQMQLSLAMNLKLHQLLFHSLHE